MQFVTAHLIVFLCLLVGKQCTAQTGQEDSCCWSTSTALYERTVLSASTMVTTNPIFHQNNYIFHPQRPTALRFQFVHPDNAQPSMHVVEEYNKLHCHGNEVYYLLYEQINAYCQQVL